MKFQFKRLPKIVQAKLHEAVGGTLVSQRAMVGAFALAAFGIGVALDLVVQHREALGTTALSIPIIVIAAMTLNYSIPKHALLTVERWDEAELTDLVFFIYTASTVGGDVQVPREYLLQLHVVVSNLGDRKALLSKIQVEGFRNSGGEVVHLPEAPVIIGGMSWKQQSGYINTQRMFQNMSEPLPYILESDDVVVIRFRVRRGIDWSARWSAGALRTFHGPLARPIVSAFGTMTWRRAGDVIKDTFEVPIVAEQQDEYVRLIEDLSRGFTVTPTLPIQPFPLE